MWTRFCLNLAQLPDCIINVFATLPNDFYLVKMAESSRLSGPHRFPLRLYRVSSFSPGFFFVFSAVPIAESIEVEDSYEDVPELMDPAGEEFECLDSDFEDGVDELELLDSFV